jgi:hypothetical protein
MFETFQALSPNNAIVERRPYQPAAPGMLPEPARRPYQPAALKLLPETARRPHAEH